MLLQRTRHYALALIAPLALCGFAPSTSIASVSVSMPQDATHPLVMEQVGDSMARSRVGALEPFTATTPLLPRAALTSSTPSNRLDREVFGFALASSLSDPTVGYPSWNFSALTTVAFFGLHVQDDGTFANDSGAAVWNSSQLTGLVNTAHAYGTKVVLTIILQDFSAGTPHMCSGLLHASTTITNTVAQIAAKGVDGVNVDYEGLNGSCGRSDSSWARHTFTNMVASLRTHLPGGSYLSVDTYASSAVDTLGFFDVRGLAPWVDSLFVMAYDLEYSNYARAPVNCSRFCLGPTAPLAGYYYNDWTAASQYVSAVGASKVILGVPYYGRKACVASATANQYPTGSVGADTYLDAIGESTAPGVQSGSYATHRDANDPTGNERWDTWVNTTLNCTRELYWDDTTSLGAKYDLVNNDGLRGVGIWNLNYGGGAPELWQLLESKFSAQWTSLGGILASGPDVSSWASNRTDVFIRGGDNQLWQATWNGTSLSAWASLGGTITSDPGAVSWGANRIDVFARGQDDALWHVWWNGTAWSAWQSLGGLLASGPDVASWGPNRLDVFARGRDNKLWHLAWNGSAWGGWQSLGGNLTSDPGAVSWGPNRIDVFARGQNNALWHTWWNGSAWGGWESLGGMMSSGPDATSCGVGLIAVFANGNKGAAYELAFGGRWSSWLGLGGQGTADPGAVCIPSSGTVELFERGTDNALWHIRAPGY